jgi:hypothetical protein
MLDHFVPSCYPDARVAEVFSAEGGVEDAAYPGLELGLHVSGELAVRHSDGCCLVDNYHDYVEY